MSSTGVNLENRSCEPTIAFSTLMSNLAHACRVFLGESKPGPAVAQQVRETSHSNKQAFFAVVLIARHDDM